MKSTEPMLSVNGLKKYFPIRAGVFSKVVGHVRAVDDLSLDIFPGEAYALVGESGCGKTTAGQTILKLLNPTAGSVTLEGKDVFKMSKQKLRELRKEMQIIFQDPYSSLNPRMTVGETIGEALEVHGIAKGKARRQKVETVLEECGLASYHYRRYPHEFSGGQRQRIGIARAVSLNPELIVCDEPVSALDVSIQSQILNLLMDLQNEFKLTYIFISHDLTVVRHVSDRIGVMYLGRIVELTDGDTIYSGPLHPYTQALISAIPVPSPGKGDKRIILEGSVPSPISPPSGCHFRTRCPIARDICSVQYPELKNYAGADGDHYVACHFAGEKII